MSWWGKVIGGTFGLMAGGPLGALLGSALGHQLDKKLTQARRQDETERIQTAFFTATFSIMGHLAKADGRVSETEIALARQVMEQMHLDENQKRAAIRLFNEGKSADFPLEQVVAQFRRECGRRRNLLQMFLEMLIATALADGAIQPVEKEVLLRVCNGLGFSRFFFEQLLNMISAQQRFRNQYQQGSGAHTEAATRDTLANAYGVLGVTEDTPDADVKKAYRRLMSQHHPDKLVAKGLPEEMMQLATEKTREIKAAYERVKLARGMR